MRRHKAFDALLGTVLVLSLGLIVFTLIREEGTRGVVERIAHPPRHAQRHLSRSKPSRRQHGRTVRARHRRGATGRIVAPGGIVKVVTPEGTPAPTVGPPVVHVTVPSQPTSEPQPAAPSQPTGATPAPPPTVTVPPRPVIPTLPTLPSLPALPLPRVPLPHLPPITGQQIP